MSTNEDYETENPIKDPGNEAIKTTGRMTTIGAISVVVTYLISLLIPSMSFEVVLAILFLGGVAVDRFNHVDGGRFKLPF